MNRQWRALSFWQPWGTMCGMSLNGVPVKEYETRGWYSSYRGWLMIHASKKNQAKSPFQTIHLFGRLTYPQDERLNDVVMNAHEYPTGAVVAIARLVNCLEMVNTASDKPSHPGVEAIAIDTIDPTELKVGLWQPGRFAWKLAEAQLLAEPIPDPAPKPQHRGLWYPSDALIQAVEAAVTVAA